MKNFYCKIIFFIFIPLIFSCLKFSSKNKNNDNTLFFLLANSNISNNASIEFLGTKYSSVAFSILNNPSINIGNSNFTIEFWIKIKSISSNPNCSNTTDVFTNGDIIFDRDNYNAPDYGDFGFSVMQDRKIAFSFRNNDNSYTLCTNPLD